jgi:hypothetical protein
MSTVLQFPRARRALADLSRAALVRRCRIGARIDGCNEAQRYVVAHAAGIQFDHGAKPDAIYNAARDLAKKLVAMPHDQEPRP